MIVILSVFVFIAVLLSIILFAMAMALGPDNHTHKIRRTYRVE